MIKKQWRRAAGRAGIVLLAAAIVLVALDLCFPLPHDRLFPKSSTLVLDNQGELLRAFLAPDDMWRLRVRRDEIASALVDAVLAYEDRHFFHHPGVNPAALVRAAIANLRAGNVVQGGSTITMQVARMIEPKERTVMSKLIEIFRALQLELHYSKDEILTLYFNHAPYGGNIVGVGAASWAYFGKAPEQLSRGEAALLAAIPNSPNRHRPDVNPQGARRARDRVLKLQQDSGNLTAAELLAAESENIPERRRELPFGTPHLAEYLRRIYPDRERLATTIDRDVQGLAETALLQHVTGLKGRDINNGAVVIIDNRSHQLLALAGSHDFFDSTAFGQVNGALSPRSPGSALKPFVYALALGRGVISPRTLLNDVPVEFGGYRPVNYDESYSGVVSAEEALIRSLNVPAINLAATVGGEEFFRLLKSGGVSTLNKPWAQYGLPIVLGGCEVTLLELTNLYAALADTGVFTPCRALLDQPGVPGRALFAPEATYIVTEILAELRRPELPSVWDAAVNIPKVAWKTGTSLGKRDAWSIGYNRNYTVGVWIGNFDGRGSPGLVGAEVAAPLLFTIFESLNTGAQVEWFARPGRVSARQVCAVSGMPPTALCVATEQELFIEGISPNRPCDIHEQILVDARSGVRLCNHCRASHEIEERLIARWPADIATWLARHGHAIDKIPAHNPQCPTVAEGTGPVIVSPAADAEFKIRSEVAREYQKLLLDASVANETRTIYWFQNRKLIFSGDPASRVFLTPTPGRHELICMDDAGRSSQVTITIR